MSLYVTMPGEAPILCVANLSRAPQAVELDLSEFAGTSPIEMTADSVFPPIGQLPYLLTFPPYGFLWFLLCAGNQRPAWSQPASEQLPEFVTVVIREGQPGPTPDNVRLLESEVLPSWLSRRRWFASKDRPLRRVRLAALTTIPGAGFAFIEIEAELTDGTSERYVLPVAITWGTDTTTPYLAAMRKSYDPERAAQLQIVLKPNWIFSYRAGGSTHGSPHRYDTRVPLLFWGPGYVGQGEVTGRVEIADLAPTLAALAGLPAPAQAQGRDLALRP